MGSNGVDIQLSTFARQHIPFAIEAKNVESLNVWKAYEQAKHHGTIECLEPLLVIKKNNQKPLAVLDAEYLFDLLLKLKEEKYGREL